MEAVAPTRRSPRNHTPSPSPLPPRNRRRARQSAQMDTVPVIRRSPRKHRVSSPAPLSLHKPRRARKAQVQASGQAPDVQPFSHAVVAAVVSKPAMVSSQTDPSLDLGRMKAKNCPDASQVFDENIHVHVANDELSDVQDLMSTGTDVGQTSNTVGAFGGAASPHGTLGEDLIASTSPSISVFLIASQSFNDDLGNPFDAAGIFGVSAPPHGTLDEGLVSFDYNLEDHFDAEGIFGGSTLHGTLDEVPNVQDLMSFDNDLGPTFDMEDAFFGNLQNCDPLEEAPDAQDASSFDHSLDHFFDATDAFGGTAPSYDGLDELSDARDPIVPNSFAFVTVFPPPVAWNGESPNVITEPPHFAPADPERARGGYPHALNTLGIPQLQADGPDSANNDASESHASSPPPPYSIPLEVANPSTSALSYEATSLGHLASLSLAPEARDGFATADTASLSNRDAPSDEQSAVSRTPSPAPSPHYLRDFDDEDNLILNVVGPWSRNAFGRRVLKLALTLGDAHAIRFVADSFPVQDVRDAWLWVEYIKSSHQRTGGFDIFVMDVFRYRSWSRALEHGYGDTNEKIAKAPEIHLDLLPSFRRVQSVFHQAILVNE
ncbi:hypothetical protein AURDEDRAFT_159319 [Auricularia subglabra TFB-10046 SS5]|nr:hypothetical protein AURDEDRAFT_159319 [Auricularia subglabra TFB-10046 SS5]